VVGVGIAGFRVDEDVQPVAVGHQPRHHGREQLRLERDLVHRNRVRPHRLVVPAAHANRESLLDARAHGRRNGFRLRVVINVRVILDHARRLAARKLLSPARHG